MLPQNVRSERNGGVFYLHGEDEYRRNIAARELVDLYVDPATESFNLDRLDASSISTDQLASLIDTPPMMAEWRVLQLANVERIAGNASMRKILLSTARKPPSGLALILTATVPPKSRAAFYRDMNRHAKSLEFRLIPEDAVPAWIVTWAREQLNVTVEFRAARALTGSAGTDLGILTQEVRKLADMVEDGAPVDVAAVERGGLRLPRQNRWEWFDLVGRRQIRDAVRGLPILLEQGETAIGLVIGLSTQLLRIGVAVEGGISALSESLPPYQRFLAQRIAGQARGWSSTEIAGAVHALGTLDWRLKTGSLPHDVALETWLWGLEAGGPHAGKFA